jgi:hypothetical protein
VYIPLGVAGQLNSSSNVLTALTGCVVQQWNAAQCMNVSSVAGAQLGGCGVGVHRMLQNHASGGS